MQKLIKLITSFFYIGYLPVMPGTFGSLAGILIYFFIKDSLPHYAGVTIFLLLCGFLTAGSAEKIFSVKDPHKVVIDEVCGMLLCFFLIPFNKLSLILGFVLFRILDVVKPYPAAKLQGLKGSLGIMLDDIVVAIYTNIALHAFNLFLISKSKV